MSDNNFSKMNFIEYLHQIDKIMGRDIILEEVDLACISHTNNESPEICAEKIKRMKSS